MAKRAVKKDRNQDATEPKTGDNISKSWQVDDKLKFRGFLAGPPFSREELRELLIELREIIQLGNKNEILARKADLTRINDGLKEFLYIQHQKYIDRIQWKMLDEALEHLVQLNLEITRFLDGMSKIDTFDKKKVNMGPLLDMVQRSSKEAISSWHPNSSYDENGRLNLNH